MTTAYETIAVNPERQAATRSSRMSSAKASDLLPLCDFAGLFVAGYLSLFACTAFFSAAIAQSHTWNELHRLTWIAAGIAPFLLYERRFADFAKTGDNLTLIRGFVGRFLMFLGLIGVIAFAGRWLDDAPHGWLALWLGSAFLLTVTSRVLLARYLRHLTQREAALADMVAVVGTGPLLEKLIPLLRRNAALFGVFDDHRARTGGRLLDSEPAVENLIARARTEKLDRIIVALPPAATGRLPYILERLRPLSVPVELCPQNVLLRFPTENIAHVGDKLPVTLLADRPIHHWNAALKSAEDFLLSIILTILLVPILAVIALAIKLDSPGSIFFTQRRHGINNREFNIYKFRTMRCDAEGSDKALKQTVRGDSRVTRVGRFLRKWSLDELPQVFNVLDGTMSLVGPRPLAVNMRTEKRLGHEIIDVYPHRHRVKPGITGWSQVNGSRGATDTMDQLRQRIELDLYYVDHWSLLLDVKILAMTAKEVLRATNAY